MLIGAKLQHVVSTLALEIMEQTGPFPRTQVKPRDDLFWFKKPDILLWLIQFVIFQVRIDKHFICRQVMLHGCVFCSYFLYCSCRMHSKWQRLFGHW